MENLFKKLCLSNLMNRRLLTKLLLILTLLGIFLILTGSLVFPFISQGKITNFKDKGKYISFNLENDQTEYVIFKNSKTVSNLDNGMDVKISGRKDLYRGKEQIIVDKIEGLHDP